MEIYKAAPFENGRYLVSNLGNIKRAECVRFTPKNKKYLAKEKILKQWFRGEYLSVEISSKSYPVHRLVALCFKENPHNFSFVNHKNGIKTDNRAENLEWCTKSYNALHMYATGLKKKTYNEEAAHFVHSNEKIIEVKKLLSENVLTQREITKITGVPQPTISAINRGKFRTKI